GDVGGVLRRPEGHEHLGARAVPAGRDAVLGQQHSHAGVVLHPVGGDVADLGGSVLLGGVVPQNVSDLVTAQVGPPGEDRVQRAGLVFAVGPVGQLAHHQRDDGVFSGARAGRLGGLGGAVLGQGAGGVDVLLGRAFE